VLFGFGTEALKLPTLASLTIAVLLVPSAIAVMLVALLIKNGPFGAGIP
jgi:hypothetical protein